MTRQLHKAFATDPALPAVGRLLIAAGPGVVFLINALLFFISMCVVYDAGMWEHADDDLGAVAEVSRERVDARLSQA